MTEQLGKYTMTEQSGYVHNDRVSKKAQLLGAVVSVSHKKAQKKGRLTVKELSGKVHGGRAVRKSTRWQSYQEITRRSCQEMYTVAERSGKVHGGRTVRKSTQWPRCFLPQ